MIEDRQKKQKWEVRYLNKVGDAWSSPNVWNSYVEALDHEHESACERSYDLDGQVRVQVDGSVTYVIVEDENCQQLEVTRIEEVQA